MNVRNNEKIRNIRNIRNITCNQIFRRKEEARQRHEEVLKHVGIVKLCQQLSKFTLE